MSDSPQLPRSLVTTERQRNAMDAFPSLKYRSSHKLSHDFMEENSDKRKSLPSTFHQVYPSNRDSNHVSESSYGYVPYHPAPVPLESGSHYEVLQNPIYCNLPFQNNEVERSFVPLTRHNISKGYSQDSLDNLRDTISPPKPLSGHIQSFPTTPDNETFQPVRFITMDEDKHTSHRSLATPVSTRLFISSTPVDPEMVSLSASQNCVYDSDKNTQKKCIRMLSQSMNLNPDITSWVIPSGRAKRQSLASADQSSVDQSDESLGFQSADRIEEVAPRKEKVFGKIIREFVYLFVCLFVCLFICLFIDGIVGFFRTRPKRKSSQSNRRVDKRKSRIGVIEHLTPSGGPSPLMSTPRELSPLSHCSVSYQPQLVPQYVPHSETPHRKLTPIFKELGGSLPNSAERKASSVSRDTLTPQFERQISNHSNLSQNQATARPKLHTKPTTLPLHTQEVYENLPYQRAASKPPLPHSNSIYSNVDEMARTCSDTLPPIER